MIHKASLKKINDVIQWIVIIALIGVGIYYFFISKDMFKEMGWLIVWSGIGILNAGRIIDSKYFEDNLSWKNNWQNIIQMPMSAVIVVCEIKRLWF
ncbi:hypothetical protein KPL35_18010 [Clostridium sp. CF011]|uniref:hypothetical protein n=1 Tax=Clostridium sp. CF011 TaxID=2843318 RepID=UPI001C0DE723|nr:hypothetical protein [Clostridium sp. CF011]MBU3093927.1 hypothetical protein [Clostridium sp. CF011]WAG71789.1 hypothetical protein LL036_19020 [Clostridium sp. CF011]